MQNETFTFTFNKQTLDTLLTLACEGAKAQQGDRGIFAYAAIAQDIEIQIKKEKEEKEATANNTKNKK